MVQSQAFQRRDVSSGYGIAEGELELDWAETENIASNRS
jgi:hypothetical protein